MRIDFSKFIKSDYSKFFIKDEYGNKVFYTSSLSKGRIVPDKETYEKITRGLEQEEKINLPCIIAVALFICSAVFLDVSIILLMISLLMMGLTFFISHRLFLYPITRTLAPAPRKLKSKDHLIALASTPSFLVYFIFIAFTALYMICIYLRFDNWDLEILTPIPLFIAGLIIKIKNLKN